MLHVFRQEETAVGFGSGAEDNGVPKAKLAGREVGGGNQDRGGRFGERKRVTPGEDCGSSLSGCAASFAHKNLE